MLCFTFDRIFCANWNLPVYKSFNPTDWLHYNHKGKIYFRIFWSELINDLRFKEYFYKWVALRVLPLYSYDIFHQFFCFKGFSVSFSTVGWWYKDTINGLIVITMCKDHWEYSVTSVTRGTCLVTQPNELTEQQSKVTSFIQNFLVTEYQMLLSFIFAFWTILNNKYHFKLKIVS